MTRVSLARSWRGEAVVAATVEALWAVVSDVTRTGEWSHECEQVEWLDGATTAEPGVRFRGGNHAALWRWHRTSEITDVSPGRSIGWRTLSTWRYVDSTQWRLILEPVDDGHTRIVQTYDVLRCPRWWELVVNYAVPPHRDRSAALDGDLHRLGALAAGVAAPAAADAASTRDPSGARDAPA